MLQIRIHDPGSSKAHAIRPVLADLPYGQAWTTARTPADRSAFRRLAVDADAYGALGRRPTLIRLRYVVPRFLRAALVGDYYRTLEWMAPFGVLHLLQVERFCAKLDSLSVGARPEELRRTPESEVL